MILKYTEQTLTSGLINKPTLSAVTPILWPHTENAEGHKPIWLRFSDTHRTLYASLGVYIHPRHWNERKREVRKGHDHHKRINALIATRLAEAEDERLRLLMAREPVTAEALKAAVANEATGGPAACFLRFSRALLEEVERQGNVARYRKESAVLNKLEKFACSGAKGAGRLPFDQLTPDFLRRYETHLRTAEKNKASTIRSNMNILRTHYRRAIKEGVVTREADPFFSYSPPKAARPKRHKLTAAELAKVEGLDLGGTGPAAPLIARVRDAFLFALYLAGMRFADVARLRCGDLSAENGERGERLRLSYTMGKTGKGARLLLILQAERIARAYFVDEQGAPKPADAFLFPMLEGYDLSTAKQRHNAVSAQNTVHNKYLKKIGEKAEVGGTLSFHIARHSFADLARKQGWDVYAISKALAHSNLGVTEQYLAGFDGDLVDEKMDALFTDSQDRTDEKADEHELQ